MKVEPGWQTELAGQLAAVARGHEREAELIEKANAFEAAAIGVYASPPTSTIPKLLGCWARARRAYCEITGEPLI